MEKLLLVVLLSQVLSYNLFNLSVDLGIIQAGSLNTLSKYYKLRIIDISKSNNKKSQYLKFTLAITD